MADCFTAGTVYPLLVSTRNLWQNFLMSDKEVVIETLQRMPEGATIEQISEEIAILAAIQKGEKASDAGQVTPHEQVRQKLATWISK